MRIAQIREKTNCGEPSLTAHHNASCLKTHRHKDYARAMVTTYNAVTKTERSSHPSFRRNREHPSCSFYGNNPV